MRYSRSISFSDCELKGISKNFTFHCIEIIYIYSKSFGLEYTLFQEKTMPASGKTFIFILCFLLVSCSFSAAEKNVILIIPDGCSTTMWASIRAMTVGAGSLLNIDRLPVQGRCRTYSADALITDSAAAGTAYACGIKTINGVLGKDATTILGDSLSGKPITSFLELAEKSGYSTGLITTSSIEDATPGAFYTHRSNRSWWELIANDLVGKGIEVIMGGGRNYMIPNGTVDEEGAKSSRKDSRNIIREMQGKGYTYVYNTVGFNAIDPGSRPKVLGLFNAGDMQFELNRAKDKAGEPALWEMTEKAIQILAKNKKGFFLLVESGIIDHAAHQHKTQEFLWEGIACDKTVGVALDFAVKNKNTLMIVVPDHSTGGPYLAGMYDLSKSDSTITSSGFPKYVLGMDGFPVSDGGKPIAIQWIKSTGHTGEDVTVSAYGPNSADLCGVIQNTDVFKVMCKHLGVGKQEKKNKGYEVDY
jgi:alkaline phosphatase